MGIGIMVKPPKSFRDYIKYSGSQASLRKSGDKRESRIKSSLLKVLKGGYYLKNGGLKGSVSLLFKLENALKK